MEALQEDIAPDNTDLALPLAEYRQTTSVQYDGRHPIWGPTTRPRNETGALHALQVSEWGWRDMRRKTASQMDSPCECNRTGRCWKDDCCLRWPEGRPHE